MDLKVEGLRVRRAPHGLVRDAIIDALSEHLEGLMLRDLSEQVRQRVPGEMHPRTPSMALDRLRKEGIVSRSGRRWILQSRVNVHLKP
jgi:DNA-binding transcriptional ArsR family regulator